MGFLEATLENIIVEQKNGSSSWNSWFAISASRATIDSSSPVSALVDMARAVNSQTPKDLLEGVLAQLNAHQHTEQFAALLLAQVVHYTFEVCMTEDPKEEWGICCAKGLVPFLSCAYSKISPAITGKSYLRRCSCLVF